MIEESDQQHDEIQSLTQNSYPEPQQDAQDEIIYKKTEYYSKFLVSNPLPDVQELFSEILPFSDDPKYPYYDEDSSKFANLVFF